jgi:hypothetical protein
MTSGEVADSQEGSKASEMEIDGEDTKNMETEKDPENVEGGVEEAEDNVIVLDENSNDADDTTDTNKDVSQSTTAPASTVEEKIEEDSDKPAAMEDKDKMADGVEKMADGEAEAEEGKEGEEEVAEVKRSTRSKGRKVMPMAKKGKKPAGKVATQTVEKDEDAADGNVDTAEENLVDEGKTTEDVMVIEEEEEETGTDNNSTMETEEKADEKDESELAEDGEEGKKSKATPTKATPKRGKKRGKKVVKGKGTKWANAAEVERESTDVPPTKDGEEAPVDKAETVVEPDAQDTLKSAAAAVTEKDADVKTAAVKGKLATNNATDAIEISDVDDDGASDSESPDLPKIKMGKC